MSEDCKSSLAGMSEDCKSSLAGKLARKGQLIFFEVEINSLNNLNREPKGGIENQNDTNFLAIALIQNEVYLRVYLFHVLFCWQNILTCKYSKGYL